MVKSRNSRAEREYIDVRYDLFELPTAQHKAGLAGLLLQIKSMQERQSAKALSDKVKIPQILEQGGSHAVIRFTKESTQALLDDLYEAEMVEIEVASPWPGKPPKKTRQVVRRDPQSKKVRREKRFVYDNLQAKGPFLARFTNDGKEAWQRLWRSMLWAIPRAQPRTRLPYQSRADAKPTREGSEAWKNLLAFQKAESKGCLASVRISGATLLGAQSTNAESVKFEDQAHLSLLLHFWQLTVRIFVPEAIDRDGETSDHGYVLAVPEVSNLQEFTHRYRQHLHFLGARRRRYWPADAVVSLPAEGAAIFLAAMTKLLGAQIGRQESIAMAISGVEYFHSVKQGKNVKMASHGRFTPDRRLLRSFAGIQKQYQNTLFRRSRLLAAQTKQPWFVELKNVLATAAAWSLVHSNESGNRTPSAMISFAYDVTSRFTTIQARQQLLMETAVQDTTTDPSEVDRLVYALVGAYVKIIACQRAGVDPWTTGDEWWSKTADERRHVCSKLFIELRSRHGADFASHFTNVFAAVPQWLNREQYLAVADALLREFTIETGENRPRTRDDVKTLVLLALSAHSRSLSQKDDENSSTADSSE